MLSYQLSAVWEQQVYEVTVVVFAFVCAAVVSAWAMPNVEPRANVIAKDKDNLFSFIEKAPFKLYLYKINYNTF